VPNISGTTITFDLYHVNTAQVSPNQNTGSVNNNSILTKNSTVIPPTSQPVATYVNANGNTIDGCQMEDVYVTQKSDNWVSVSVTNGDVMVINTTTTVNKPLTRVVCSIVTSNDSFDITNAIISGCDCCELVSPNQTNDSSGASGSSGNSAP
jgi:pyruvate kinase